MENFTEGCGDDGAQGFIFPLTTKQFGVQRDRHATTLGKLSIVFKRPCLRDSCELE